MSSLASIGSLTQITLAISVRYGYLCSERSISIHSRFPYVYRGCSEFQKTPWAIAQ
jgi:hypothetical protein